MEVVRDRKDNCIIVCSIENLDPMGVHTGDSITVAPAQTLTDKEYQRMRDASIAVLRKIGVECGGSNVQFAVSPDRRPAARDRDEPARVALLGARLEGHRLPDRQGGGQARHRLHARRARNEITGGATPASFEPAIDYVVTKMPRFTFEKFPGADARLTTQMKSVGEAMAIGRTFQESLQKALRSLETGCDGLTPILRGRWTTTRPSGSPRNCATPVPTACSTSPTPSAPAGAWSACTSARASTRGSWCRSRTSCARSRRVRAEGSRASVPTGCGSSSARASPMPRWRGWPAFPRPTCARRHALGIRPVFKRVDTCAAEFATSTAYLYSTYEEECEAAPTSRRKIMILGGGPNRIGQGIEFDYCCVHAALALREDGFETLMVNCNPETVSTDYDTSDRLYFEPLTFEDVMEIIEIEKPEGVIVQYGGQTPLKLSRPLAAAGAPIIGTTPDSIDAAEDRERFQKLIAKLGLRQPANATARNEEQAVELARAVGYPLVVGRPTCWAGGRWRSSMPRTSCAST
jgi:carbamoyl-phosphate synthase large subunit